MPLFLPMVESVEFIVRRFPCAVQSTETDGGREGQGEREKQTAEEEGIIQRGRREGGRGDQ